jgi:hypothetical protein
MRDMVRYYTREAGVRNLEREIAKLARKAVREIAGEGAGPITVDPAKLSDYLGVRRHRYGMAEAQDGNNRIVHGQDLTMPAERRYQSADGMQEAIDHRIGRGGIDVPLQLISGQPLSGCKVCFHPLIFP